MNRVLFSILLLLIIDHSYSQHKIADTTEFEIPVVFHFVTKNKPITKYTYPQIENILIEVTRRMNTIDYKKLRAPFDKIARKTYLKFVIRKFDKNCQKIDPITYHKTPLNGYTPWVDDAYLRAKGYFKPKEFLNIWVCNLYGKNITGHTPKKQILNGIIIDEFEFDKIIINKNQTWTLAHEIGHWLGLKHIWGGIDTSIDLDDCLIDDGIDDTPKQKDPHFFDYTYIQNSCNGKEKTNHQNFMDYSYDVGMFTEQQVEVMRMNLKTKHAGLLWKTQFSNCLNSILSYTKQRNKLGAKFNFNSQLDYNTNIDLTLKGFFEREIHIPFTSENLEKIGLKIIGTDKFKDLATGKLVSQDYIYKYLDIEKAKLIVNKVFPKNQIDSKKSEKNLSIGIENRKNQKIKLVLINKATNKEYVYEVDKVLRTYLTANSVMISWVKLPEGNYIYKVYTQADNKLISTSNLTLNKNNQLVTINSD